jgi:prefoldin alpha subunit
MEEEQQELIMKLSFFEQQIQHVQKQLQAVEQGIVEISSLSIGLEELKGAEGKEVLAPLGRGIFAKTKLLSEDLIVDIGGKTFIKKTIPETQSLIQEQISKLEEIQKSLESNLEEINNELTRIFTEAQDKENGRAKEK